MKGEQEQIKQSLKDVGESVGEKRKKNLEEAAKNILQKQVIPKEALGMSDQMIEGIYGQAYRLYNTGKYEDASQLFRLLVMMNSTESKYAMGLAACFHMMKDYKSAINTYTLCGIIDPKSPVPHYHASDCYIQLKDPMSAIVALEMAIKRAEGKPEFKSIQDRAKMTVEALKKEVNLAGQKRGGK
jgi:type III secretion system low calcium response chaperone LcrH/SycD